MKTTTPCPPMKKGGFKNCLSNIKVILILLMFISAAKLSNAQICPDPTNLGCPHCDSIHPAPSCNLDGPLIACLNGGNDTIRATIDFSGPTDSLVYSFAVNQTGADKVDTNFVSYLDSEFIENIIIFPGTTSGSINLALDVYIRYPDGCVMHCECSKSITIIQVSPTVSFQPIACSGGTTTLTVSGSGATTYNYSVNPGNFNNTTGIFPGLSAGNYTVSVAGTKNLVTCDTTTTVHIPSAQGISVTCSNSGPETCTNLSVTLTANNCTGSGINYSWSGPGGFTSTLQCPTATRQGAYTVIATLASGGCSATCTTTVDSSCSAAFWGCTLGFWKNHTDIWNNPSLSISQCLATAISSLGSPYSGNGTASSSFASTFGLSAGDMTAAGLSPTLTLLEALQTGGGGCKDLARQGVAALLNTCGLSGHYYYNSAQVLTTMHTAYTTRNCNLANPSYDNTNEQQPDNCPPAGRASKNPTSRLGVVVNEDVIINAYPNPFSDKMNIEITPSKDFNQVTVQVFDLNGRVVAELYNSGMKEDQFYKFGVDGTSLPQGIYIYRVTMDDESYNGKIVLINK